ncbi:MAG: chemotaxis protein CheX [Terriglobales bacterium]
MDTQIREATYQADVDQIVATLFLTMLATEASPAQEDPPRGQDVITSVMPFAGTWKGDLVLECHWPQARCFAQRFLQTDEIDEFSEDIPSTIAELANIIAGNLKSVLPPGVSIGTPSIIQGKDYTVRVCGGKTICHRAFATDAGGFLLRLIEKRDHTEGKP